MEKIRRTTIKELLAHASEHEGKKVDVKGWVRPPRQQERAVRGPERRQHHQQPADSVRPVEDSGGRPEGHHHRQLHPCAGRADTQCRQGPERGGTGRRVRAVRHRRSGHISPAEEGPHAGVPAREGSPASAHQHVRRRAPHTPRAGFRRASVLQRQGILLLPHSADHGLRLRGRRRPVPGNHPAAERPAQDRGWSSGLFAGLLRQDGVADGVRPAGR